MCYSFKSSISTFLIAMITVFLMYKRQTKVDKYVSPFILVYGFMQLAEAFMWYDTNCGIINKIGSHLAYIDLMVHLLAAGVGIYLAEGRKYGIIIGGLFALYLLINMPKIKCSKYKNNTMYWGFDSRFYRYIYLLIIILLAFCKMTFKYKIFLVSWFTASWLYFFNKQVKDFSVVFGEKYDSNLISSLWCHMVSFSAPGLYLIQNFI